MSSAPWHRREGKRHLYALHEDRRPRRDTCRGCGASVVFVRTPKGAALILDLLHSEEDAAGLRWAEPHWGYCPERDRFRGRRTT